MTTYYLPAEEGVVDAALDAMTALLTKELQTDIPAGDVSRMTTILVGYRQEKPTGVHVMVYENDPMNPQQWPHRPIRFKQTRTTGGLVGDAYSETEKLRATSGRVLIGGGGQYTRAFLAEVEIYGRTLPRNEGDSPYTRREVGQVAKVVSNRLTKALLNAGPWIGTGAPIAGDMGETLLDGPFLGESWVDQQEGEALIVREYVQFWYVAFKDWSTDAWQ
jgi:hypothetical protein